MNKFFISLFALLVVASVGSAVTLNVSVEGQEVKNVSRQTLNISKAGEVGGLTLNYENLDNQDYKIAVDVGGDAGGVLHHFDPYEVELDRDSSASQSVFFSSSRNGSWDGSLKLRVYYLKDEAFEEDNETYYRTVKYSEVSVVPVTVDVGSLENYSFPVSMSLRTQFDLEEVEFCQNATGVGGVVQEVCVSALMPRGIPLRVVNVDEEFNRSAEEINVSVNEPLYPYSLVNELEDGYVELSGSVDRLSSLAEDGVISDNNFLREERVRMEEEKIPSSYWSGVFLGVVGGGVLVAGIVVAVVYLFILKQDESQRMAVENPFGRGDRK